MVQQLTILAFLAVGCGTHQETTGDKVIATDPSTPHPPNCGRICRWHAHEVTSATHRKTQLLTKKDNAFQPVSWREAYGSLKNAARYLTNVLVLCSKNIQCLGQTLLSINVEVKDGSRSKRELFPVGSGSGQW